MTKNDTTKVRAAMLAAAKQVEEAAKGYRLAAEGTRMAGVKAAIATAEAERVGYLHTARLGKGESVPPGALDRQQYADLFGVSTATVSLWRNAGRAFALGISPESNEGRALMNGAANKAAITSVLKGERPSAAKIRAAVKATVGTSKTGKAPEKGHAQTGKATGADEKTDAYQSGRNNTVRMDRIETELAAIRSLTKTERARLVGIITAQAEALGLVLVPETEADAA